MNALQRRDAATRIVAAVAVGALFFFWQELALAVTGAVGVAAGLTPRRA